MVDIARPKSAIKKIIIHCSDTDLAEFDNIESVKKWHLLKSWSDIGYHYFIDKSGHVFDGRPMEKAGANCAGHNYDSVGICLSGRQIFYDPQFRACWFLVTELMKRYDIKRSMVFPHNAFNHGKTCPNFDITKIWKYDNETTS